MIHTIISLDDILWQENNEEIVTECVSGGYAEYYTLNGKRTLRRFFSTNPALYLNQSNFR